MSNYFVIIVHFVMTFSIFSDHASVGKIYLTTYYDDSVDSILQIDTILLNFYYLARALFYI